jgi:nitroreductase
MDLDPAMIDAALTTTRAVRKRLDLDRRLDDQVLLDCIDVAEQAPTGGNTGSRRWIVIRDQRTKDSLAELYLKAGGSWVIETADRIKDTNHPNATMMQGAKYLAENLARVPALVILTVVGRHDGSGRPGLFDSVIQAGWSFQVALRARGIGTTWTTMYMREADAVAELLDIPDEVTQVALFPVAYSIGTDFSPTKRRLPAKEITYFDRYGRTIGAKRSEPATLTDEHGVAVEVDIAAGVEDVWNVVADINLPAQFSEELQGASWDDPDGERGVGTTFTGYNEHPAIGEWETTSIVSHYEPNRRFGWVVSNAENPGGQWRFELERVPGGTRLRFLMTIGPGPSGISHAINSMPDKENRIIANRQKEHRKNMLAVVAGVKSAAESA